ncbi:unnamed protein product [Brassicogethes aeneus]|uniref:Uncharacterized protein n=1 Tax=Brassicogethes aeneus TaxID=1431903 RepID=A0A9P0BLS5_BRAAE|nr:unnamed protein product [Brassicogethes aeneus]
MWVYLLFLYISTAIASNCDKMGVLLYQDMDCKPIYYGKTACPALYSCQGIKPTKKCCYYRNQCVLEEPANTTYGPPCSFGCFCLKDRLEFACPVVDCAPQVYNDTPSAPGCYKASDLNQCCYFKEICPPFSHIKCKVDGVIYKEGQQFTPKNTCWNCVCQKGWRGVNEAPFCQRRRCGVQLRDQTEVQQACAPGYLKKDSIGHTLCCPSTWLCPEEGDKILGSSNGDDICTFGNTTLKTGQFINKSKANYGTKNYYKCECSLPPLLTCVETS